MDLEIQTVELPTETAGDTNSFKTLWLFFTIKNIDIWLSY